MRRLLLYIYSAARIQLHTRVIINMCFNNGFLVTVFTMQVSVDGAIFFGQGTDTSFVRNQFPLGGGRRFVAPFWADVDTSATGEVWYRQTTDQTLLDRANMQINNAFPLQTQFTATNLIIATWDHVGYFDSKSDRVSIFSC